MAAIDPSVIDLVKAIGGSLPSLTGLAGVALGYWLNQGATNRQRQQSHQERQQERLREPYTRLLGSAIKIREITWNAGTEAENIETVSAQDSQYEAILKLMRDNIEETRPYVNQLYIEGGKAIDIYQQFLRLRVHALRFAQDKKPVPVSEMPTRSEHLEIMSEKINETFNDLIQSISGHLQELDPLIPKKSSKKRIAWLPFRN